MPISRSGSRAFAGLLWGASLSGLMFLLAGCHSSDNTTETKVDQPLPTIDAQVITLEPSHWPSIVSIQGSLVADEVAVVGAKVAGRVEATHVDLGDRVNVGEPLVTLEQDEFRLRIEQAEAELAQARAAVGLRDGQPVDALDPRESPPVREQEALWDEAQASSERMQLLYEKNAVTQNDLDSAIAAAEVAKARYAGALNQVNEKLALIQVKSAELAVARDDMQETISKAPFQGFVQQRHVAPGSYVQVGQALVTVVRSDPLRFRGTVPERYAHQVKIGQEIRLSINQGEVTRNAQVTRISPSLDPLNRALTIEAVIPNSSNELRNGLFCQARLVLDQDAQALVIPESALRVFAGTEKVWMLVDGVAQEVVVETSERRSGRVVVRKGLEQGDTFLADASEGQLARVNPIKTPSVNESPKESLAENPAAGPEKPASAPIEEQDRPESAE